MCSSARYGYKDLVDFYIEKGANNWGYALFDASCGGNKTFSPRTARDPKDHLVDIVDLFIDLNQSTPHCAVQASNWGANNWLHGRIAAAYGGQKDLVKFFQKKIDEEKKLK